MILFISNSGKSLPIVSRLRRESTDAQIYIHNPAYRKRYDGMLQKVKQSELKKAVKQSDIIVFDTTRPNARTKQDITLLKMFGLKASDPSVFGSIGDLLKQDHKVIGAGKIAEDLENKDFGVKVAEKVGFAIPEILDGVEISTEIWMGLGGPVHYNNIIEDKRLMSGNLGPSIESQSNTVWFEEPMPQLKGMAAFLKANNYIGPCSVNLIIKDNIPFFLGLTPGFKYDAIYCLFELLKDRLTDFFEKDFDVEFHDNFATSQRISIPPYPYAAKELLKKHALDRVIEGDPAKMKHFWMQDVYSDLGAIRCAGSDGVLGVVSGRGDSLGSAWGKVYSGIKKLKIGADLQYRLDGFKSAEKRLALFNKETVV